ncbi:MAG TPA: hypothetical protein VLB76_28125 [Thermoanaerobaculia bacterium]|jgi:hypothetical protein|nr:hypothetical protein [Thermoanaerobaculia bacterium]
MAKLGQLLVARGWITVQQLTRALKNQNVVGGRIGTCLLEMDAISEELLLKGLSEQLGVPSAAADDLRGIPDEVLGLIPEKLARRCRAVPFSVELGRLDLALMDPRNLSAQDEIAFASGKRVKVYVAEELRVLEALDKYYHEECPSRFGMVLDRLNRARFLWEKPAAERTEPAGELLTSLDSPFDNRLAAPPKIQPPPLLPELEPLPPRPQPVAAAAVAAFPSVEMLWPQPAPPPPAAPAAPAPVPVAATTVAAEAAPAAAPVAPPLRSQSVSLTPEERADLGAVAWVEPASTDRSLPVPASLDEVETALGKATDLEEVARVLLGFLGRDHRRAAIFQVTRERINGWRVHGTGIDREAFAAFSIGFDQPSLFLNLRHGSTLYLGPLPPMPAHRQLARTWGGDLPRDCVMLPVRIKDRLLLVVYADGATRGPVDLQQMQRLMNAATSAVERCILANRQRGEAKSQ